MCNAADLFGGVAITRMDLNKQKINPASDARDGYLWYTHLRRAKITHFESPPMHARFFRKAKL